MATKKFLLSLAGLILFCASSISFCMKNTETDTQKENIKEIIENGNITKLEELFKSDEDINLCEDYGEGDKEGKFACITPLYLALRSYEKIKNDTDPKEKQSKKDILVLLLKNGDKIKTDDEKRKLESLKDPDIKLFFAISTLYNNAKNKGEFTKSVYDFTSSLDLREKSLGDEKMKKLKKRLENAQLSELQTKEKRKNEQYELQNK